jgi:hypothetical protein
MALQNTIPLDLKNAAQSVVEAIDLPDAFVAGLETAEEIVEEVVEKVASSARQAVGSGGATSKASHRGGSHRWRLLIAVVGVSLIAIAIWRAAGAGKGVRLTGRESDHGRDPLEASEQATP